MFECIELSVREVYLLWDGVGFVFVYVFISYGISFSFFYRCIYKVNYYKMVWGV